MDKPKCRDCGEEFEPDFYRQLYCHDCSYGYDEDEFEENEFEE